MALGFFRNFKSQKLSRISRESLSKHNLTPTPVSAQPVGILLRDIMVPLPTVSGTPTS